MVIDVICVIILLMAIFKGYTRGFIVAVFSFVAIIIGLAAALKLSVVVSGWLQQHTSVGISWLPFLSFIIVMIGVILIIRWAAALIQASVETLMLGWLNRLGGIILYIALYITVLSVLLFYLTQMNIIKADTVASSKLYSLIEPVGPKAIDAFGKVIPLFKDLFVQLEQFFGRIAQKHG
ncbi:CvpA family protein [Danxiaibacter flavus]|uniref:CvpA family protein n=1 Tax=Danxiaibacter flavus TaxID=3049108 RepID=A0ABV3ZPT0_9BACT|nr:CvpA family protein [Chitinophagaceae bacterium DXS]